MAPVITPTGRNGGLLLAWDADFEKKVENLTPEQISAAVKKCLACNKLVFVAAGDFEKAHQKLADRKAQEPAYRPVPPAEPEAGRRWFLASNCL